MASDAVAVSNLPQTIHPALSQALKAKGYDTLTPVQLAVLEDGHAEADLLVSAQTGSGKTVAFGIAIAPTLLGGREKFEYAAAPMALVIAPTRELALQVKRELDWLYASAGVQTASCVGGMDIRTERRALERGCHIVVGTPGRLRDHITKQALDLSAIRAVVLDEADEMLDLGFREDLEFILDAAPEARRTLMFSATVPPAIAKLAKTFQRDAVRLTATAASERHADIEYQVMVVNKDERDNAVINTLLFHDQSNAIVFCQTREAVKHLNARLANRGFAVVALSGELTQSERTNALQAMRDGRARVCVATDVAARGIDLPNLDLVVHADLPTNPETLLHRSGRTGRAGRKGVCAIVVPAHRRGAAMRVLKLANVDVVYCSAPTSAEIEAHYHTRIVETARLVDAATESEAGLLERLVGALTPQQLALAYLRGQLAARPAPEEVSDVPYVSDKAPRRDKRFAEGGEGPTRRPDMTGGVWFSLSVGRKHRADPKWLLPLICKAGGITKGDVGSIKIDDTQSRFQITAEAAGHFADKVARDGSGEKGVKIVPLEDVPPAAHRAERGEKPFARERDGFKPRAKPKGKLKDKNKGKPKRNKGPQGPRD